MAGRKATPTAIKELAGNPGKRPLNKAEPKPRSTPPVMPGHLTAAARAEWERLLAILEPMGVVTEAEADLLAVYCQAYALWVRASREVEAKGLIVESGNGTLMRNPALIIVDNQVKTMSRCMTELGLTPSARVRLVTPNEADDPLERFLAD